MGLVRDLAPLVGSPFRSVPTGLPLETRRRCHCSSAAQACATYIRRLQYCGAVASSWTGDVVILTVTPRLRRQYAARFAAHSQELADYCSAHGVRYVRVPT